MSRKHTQRRGSSIRAKLREEGEVRNVAWRALSTTEQLARIVQRRGHSVKQMVELAKAAHNARTK